MLTLIGSSLITLLLSFPFMVGTTQVYDIDLACRIALDYSDIPVTIKHDGKEIISCSKINETYHIRSTLAPDIGFATKDDTKKAITILIKRYDREIFNKDRQPQDRVHGATSGSL